MTPLLLLDVDGVLNALSDEVPDSSVGPRWQRGVAKADGTTWPIVFALDVVERLKPAPRTGLTPRNLDTIAGVAEGRSA